MVCRLTLQARLLNAVYISHILCFQRGANLDCWSVFRGAKESNILLLKVAKIFVWNETYWFTVLHFSCRSVRSHVRGRYLGKGRRWRNMQIYLREENPLLFFFFLLLLLLLFFFFFFLFGDNCCACERLARFLASAHCVYPFLCLSAQDFFALLRNTSAKFLICLLESAWEGRDPRETETERERDRDRQSDRQTDIDRERERETDRQTDRQTETERRGRETDRDRETEREIR